MKIKATFDIPGFDEWEAELIDLDEPLLGLQMCDRKKLLTIIEAEVLGHALLATVEFARRKNRRSPLM